MDHINTNASFDVGDDNNCSQMPALPPLSKEDLIKQQLTILAESQPSPIAVDLALKKLSDEHDVGIRALRQTYEIIVKSLLRDAVAPSGELSDDAKAEKERQAQVDAEWQALVDERADEIANTANIPKELCAGLRDYCGYIASPHAAATLAITHAARLLPKSMGFVISGPSGSGKSGLVEMGALFLPPECVIRLTSVSDKALYYLGGIAHKYWLGGELRVLKIGEDDPAQQVLRQLISENRISRMIVEKDDDGKMCTVVHYTEGPAVFVMTTTSEFTAFHDEFVNRLSWIQTSDEAELTGDVLNAQAAAVAKVQDAHWKDRCELELKAWQEFHRRLKPYNVIIPFANEIVPKSRIVSTRRLFPMLLNYVKASALLHQAQRPRLGDDCIEAAVDDYRLAYELLEENAPRTLDTVSKRGRDLFDRLKTFGMNEFTKSDAQQYSAMTDSTFRRYLRELINAGCVVRIETQDKRHRFVLSESLPKRSELYLIHPDLVQIGQTSKAGQTNVAS